MEPYGWVEKEVSQGGWFVRQADKPDAPGNWIPLYDSTSIERLEKVNEALVKYAEQVRDCKYVPDYVHEWSEAVLRLAKEPA